MDILVELSIIVVIATAVTAVMRLLKQPLIMGYILTGLIVGPFALNLVTNTETMDAFAQLGISILITGEAVGGEEITGGNQTSTTDKRRIQINYEEHIDK